LGEVFHCVEFKGKVVDVNGGGEERVWGFVKEELRNSVSGLEVWREILTSVR